MEPRKKLYRSRTDRVFAGICGGLAQYFNVDTGLLRLIWVVVVIFSGLFPGVVVYLFAIALIPEEPFVEPKA
ncbi:MAG: PspC domain-containing protein [bacterium]|nr:PspC domain-containing protein [bacterium]